jgi:hypothetical protein
MVIDENIDDEKTCEQVRRARDIIMRSAGVRQFNPLILDLIQPGKVVHADRGIGKTEALLTAVYEREKGDAIVILGGHGAREAQRMREHYLDTFRIEERDVVFPYFIPIPNFSGAMGDWKCPFYVDEWWSLTPSERMRLCQYGRVHGAVGTMQGLAGCIEAFSLNDRRVNGLDGS